MESVYYLSSDHLVVCLELTPPYYDPATRHWRLSPSLFSDPAFVTMLEEELKFFFSTNDTTDVFLDQIHLPTLSAESRSQLCRPITKEEVYETINLYQAGKLQVRMGSARNSIRKRPRLYSS